ncbi:MAG: hypothetical protein SynsKO_27340 [Synoicihabitans sp.]
MISLTVTLVAMAVSLGAQTATEYEAKAAFLFNVTKFVGWPDDVGNTSAELVIAAPSSSPFRTGLESLVGKRVQGRIIRLETYAASRIPSTCDVLVVDGPTWNALTHDQRESLRSRNVLTVAEYPAFVQSGGILSLFLVEDHLAFDINIEAAHEAKLTVSANLLRLADSRRRKEGR